MICFPAKDISQLLQGRLIGNPDVLLSSVAGLDEAKQGDLSFLYDDKYTHLLCSTSASAVLVSENITLPENISATIIVVKNARLAMAELLAQVSNQLFPRKKGIEQPSYVSASAQVGTGCYIGAFAYIGENTKIGDNVQIYPQAYIGDNVTIGDNTIIYSGVKIYSRCFVGKDCIIHSGAVIGADGYGFESDGNGIHHKIPQIGTVIIEDDIEIGANTCIDRSMMGKTVVGKNTKIDNLVQIGHNVEVGESNLMCAQAGIAGSTKTGKRCLFTGQVGVAGHLQIADECIFGAQSGISSSVRKKGIYLGSPAIDAATFKRSAVVFKHLEQLQRDVDNLKKNITQ